MRLTFALIVTLIVVCWRSLAFAQFPPPGIYHCSTAAGAPVGTLSLFVAGDYQFAATAGGADSGKGQLASAGTAVTAQSGPLATVFHWTGSFSTDAHKQHTSFKFTGSDGTTVLCGR